jgi:hypothetical protein
MAKRTLVSWIAAKSFKPVDGGYLLVTSHPWLVGTGPAYIVTEAQKEALIAVMPPRRPLRMFVLLLAAMIAYGFCSGFGVSFISAEHVPIALFKFGMMAVFGAAMYAFLVVMIRRKLRRMAPILANARPMLSARENGCSQ